MTPTESSNTPAPVPKAGTENKRENALAPYLAQLSAAPSTDAEDSEVPSSISIDGEDMTLDPWEREVLRKFSSGLDSEGHAWPSLVREGLAFGAKCLLREQQHETEESRSDQTTIPLDDLIAEAAAGISILEELGASVDQLIRAGRMTEVKPLSAFRNRVRQGIDGMRRLIGGEAYAKVETKAAEMRVEQEIPEPSAAPTEVEERRRAPTQFKKDPAPVRAVHQMVVKQQRLIWPLLIVLFVSALMWVGLTVTQPRNVVIPKLNLVEFRHIRAVQTIDARPPSLYVTVNEPAWTDMGTEDRLDAIREIVSVAGQAGYVGVQLWTPDGAAVGRWLKKGGVELSRSSPEGG
jgi:hypothetical protein